MKDIKELLTESKKTDFSQIEKICAGWMKEWGAIYCGNILSAAVKGIKKGWEDVEKNYTNDDKFKKRCEDCIDKLLENINNDIY